MITWLCPEPDRLAQVPELAVLAMLDGALEATVNSVSAIFPHLDGQNPDAQPTRILRAADWLLALAADLHEAIGDYHVALEPTLPLPLDWGPGRTPR
jgi:hypothetical protein